MEEFGFGDLTQKPIQDEFDNVLKLDSEEDLKNKRARANYINKYLPRYALFKKSETVFLTLFSGSGLALGILTIVLGLTNVSNLILLILFCVSFAGLLVSMFLLYLTQRRLSIVNNLFKSAWKVKEESVDSIMEQNPLGLLLTPGADPDEAILRPFQHFDVMTKTIDGINEELTLVGVKNANLLGANIGSFFFYSVILTLIGFCVLVFMIIKGLSGENPLTADMMWARIFIVFFSTIFLAYVPLSLAANSYYNFAAKIYKKATKHIH